jgi:aldehyde:ferredoxin oxidoreductase
MKHKHHIIPRHMGGTDDPLNLIELTVEEHAEAHRKLYEEHGHIEDYCAWKGLSGQMGKEEIIRLLMDPTGRVHAEETKQKISQSHLGKPKHTEESKEKLRQFRTGMKLTEEHKEKITKSLIGNTRCLGYKHTQETRDKVSKSLEGNTRWSSNPNISEKERKRRSEAAKERWRKYREKRGLDPDKPIDKRYSK